MSKQVTSNTFSEGFIADMNPLVTPNNLLTDCLNGTFITFNGNEFTLQNDMGNAVVETAALKKGYIPIGIKEYNGIAYIVSYNPLENRVEIGSFPSPERNFSGEDFDTEDYQVEGCVLSTKKFYKPNLLHPEIGDNDTPPEITSPKLNVYTELQQPNPTLTVKTLEDYTSTFVPKNPSGLGVEDYWTLNTKHNQSDFIINKNSISDDFSSYPDLTLHQGDRYVIYHIDNNPGNVNFVKEFFSEYVSRDAEKRLFKLEVYSKSTAGNKKLLDLKDLDVLQYDKDDIEGENVLNGTDENIDYSVYQGPAGIIELVLTLEEPDRFDVYFTQGLPEGTPPNNQTMNFISRQKTSSLMQIKGFFCYIQHSQNASDNFRTFIRYNEDQLYTKITTDLYQLKKEARSLISIQGLESAEYNYYMIPFTQYGYAYNFIRSGVFVVNDTNIPIVPITFNHITWYYDSNNNEFDLSFGAILTDLDPNVTNVTQKLEIYDPWSNCSIVRDLTVGSSNMVDENLSFDLNTFNKTILITPDIKAGISTSLLETHSDLTLFQQPANPEELTLFKSSHNSLRKNHFYVLLVHYTYVVDEQTKNYSQYRYFYTNDKFNGYTTTSDFSLLSYPAVDLQIVQDSSTSSVDVTLIPTTIDKTNYVYDPRFQQIDPDYKEDMFLRAPTTYAINYLNLLSKANPRTCKTIQTVEKETSYKLQTVTSTENLGVVNMLDVLDISQPVQQEITIDENTRVESRPTDGKSPICLNPIVPVHSTITISPSLTLQNQFIVNFESVLGVESTAHYYYQEYDNGGSYVLTPIFLPFYFQQSKEVQEFVQSDIAVPKLSCDCYKFLDPSAVEWKLLQTLYLNDIVKFDLKKYAPANLQGHLVHTVFGNPSAVSTEIDIFRNLNLHLINNPSTAYESSFLMATKQPHDENIQSSLSLMKIKPSVINSPDNLEEDEEEYFLFFPGSGGGNDRSIGFLIKDNVNYRDIIKDIVCGSGHSMFNTVPLYYVDHNIKHYEPIGSYQELTCDQAITLNTKENQTLYKVFVFNKNSYEKLDISLDKFFFENEGSVAKYDVPEDFFPKSNEQALTITMDVNENIYPTKKYFYSTITIPESYSLQGVDLKYSSLRSGFELVRNTHIVTNHPLLSGYRSVVAAGQFDDTVVNLIAYMTQPQPSLIPQQFYYLGDYYFSSGDTPMITQSIEGYAI